MKARIFAVASIVWLGLACLPSTGLAGPISFDVTIDTSSLIGNAHGPFAVDLQLNAGGTAGNNSATISGFSFGAGGSLGAIVPGNIGTFSGSLASTLNLTDANPSTDFAQYFTPGSLLQFHVTLTTNLNSPASPPDLFSMGILYGDSLLDIPTLGPLNQLVSVAIDGPNPTIQVFASDPRQTPSFNIPVARINSVPAPAGLILLGSGIIGAGLPRLLGAGRRSRPG